MHTRWFPFALVAALVAVAGALAQPPAAPKGGKVVVSFAANAAAPPLPALKYRLLPDYREVQPGNQIPAFYKCFFEQHRFFFDKESVEQREKWRSAPLAELKDVPADYGGASLRQADYAARLDAVDWQLTNQLKSDGAALLLPDLQQLRVLVAALNVRMRAEVARGHVPAALRTAQTMFALSRACGTHPTLIGNLVGLATAASTLDAVEELARQPGAPNLFWALADLPVPVIDLRTGMQGERVLLGREFDVLEKSIPLSDDELKQLAGRYDPLFKLEGGDATRGAWDTYRDRAGDPAAVTAARERLAKAGYKAEDQWSAVHVVMADDYLSYRVALDDMMKWTNVPFWLTPAEGGEPKRGAGLSVQVLPALLKVRQSQVRVQQRVALFQVVEALRAHAAGNGGKLPATLDAVTLPVPTDPVTGKPFAYEVKAGTATVRATPPPGRKDDPQFNRVYEVAIRK